VSESSCERKKKEGKHGRQVYFLFAFLNPPDEKREGRKGKGGREARPHGTAVRHLEKKRIGEGKEAFTT